jgi:hypothetical protein
MKINFELKDDGSIPIVTVDGQQLSVISLTYAWHTITDKISDGANICIVDGFLNGGTLPRRFLFNILKGTTKEEPYINESERVFEVCVDPGDSAETEVWVKTPFADLKAGNLVRIIDAGIYYKDLSGNMLWVVVNVDKILEGRIDVEPVPSQLATPNDGYSIDKAFDLH